MAPLRRVFRKISLGLMPMKSEIGPTLGRGLWLRWCGGVPWLVVFFTMMADMSGMSSGVGE